MFHVFEKLKPTSYPTMSPCSSLSRKIFHTSDEHGWRSSRVLKLIEDDTTWGLNKPV